MSTITKDNFLSEITKINCFNIKAVHNSKYEKNSFYSLISRYDPKLIEKCYKSGLKYINSRIVLKYDQTLKNNDKKPIDYDFVIDEKYNKINLKSDINEIIPNLYKTSRFYKDIFFRKYAKKIYDKWFYNSIFNHYADKVLFAKTDKNKIIGFITLKLIGGKCLIDLIAVNPKYQNKGVGTLLISKAIKSFSDYEITVGTEAENIKAVNFYLKNNFKIVDYYLIFHRHN